MRIHGAYVLLVTGLSVVGCQQPVVLVPVPSSETAPTGPFGAAATENGVTIEGRTEAWAGVPRDLDRVVTPVLVHVKNGAKTPLRVSRDAFVLVAGQRITGAQRFRALAPDVLGDSGELAEKELRFGILEPGAETTGFLYFERVVGRWGLIHLRTTLVDPPSGANVGTIDIPFAQGRIRTCALAGPPARDIIFDTCLPPL